MTSRLLHSDPTCPRCGCDLRGPVATWEAQGVSPLDGTCTECGLTFRWVDVFDPTREEPRWCVEYAPGRGWPMAKAMVGTFARSWLPWVFWRRLRLHHEMRLRRIAVYLIALFILPATLMYLVMQSTAAINARYQMSSLYDSLGWQVPSLRAELEVWRSFQSLEDTPSDWVESAVHFVQRMRLAEQAVDGDALSQKEWEQLLGAVTDFYEATINDLEVLRANPPHFTIGYGGVVVEAIFRPSSNNSRGVVQWPDRTEAYLSPREIHGWFPAANWRINDIGDVLGELMERTSPLFAWLVLLAAYPFAFSLLPITRRRARVRWRHLARIGLYSITVPIVFFHLYVLSFAASLWHERAFAIWDDWIDLAVGLGPLPFAVAWWYFAIRTHLRLPHPLLVTIVLAVLTPLAVLAGLMVPFYVMEFLSR